MSWRKLLRHDLRCGLFRWRYLFAAALLSIPLLVFASEQRFDGVYGSWMDNMLFLFQGKYPPMRLEQGERFELPVMWLLAVGGCLFMNLDYLLKDLTREGQQVIIRSGKRMGWYLSKCVWNVCSCVLYCAVAALTALVFTLINGGAVTARNNPDISFLLFGFVLTEQLELSAWEGLLVGMLVPMLTVAAFSMLEMTLCLLVKPIVSFLITVGLLVLSVYWCSPFALGNGAMTMRSSLVAGQDGVSWEASIVLAVAVIAASAIIGTLRFRHADILGNDE